MARTAIVWIAGLLVACAAEREHPDATPQVTWQDDLAGIVPARCGDCHAGATPAAGIDLTSYENVIGDGNATAGDASSPILTALGDATHAPVADLLPLLTSWVVDSRLAYFDTPLHSPYWLNPADPAFHGTAIVASNYDFATCQTCHGQDFGGGTSGKSCDTCHKDPGGPVACTTCHGQPPPTGAHARHIAAGRTCIDCHPTPTAWNSAGHLPSLDVVLGAAAANDLVPPRRTGPPTYDPSTKTCKNVFCHGGAFGAGAGTFSSPKWNDGDAAIGCGGCHGAPPADHGAGETECAICHQNTTHMDGHLDVGQACNSCHGGANNPAPPRGLHGEVATSALAVGAHQGHVVGTTGLTIPIPCSECHVTPTSVTDPGHLDGDDIAEVFPAGAGTISRTGGNVPSFDRATGTCANTYCHGTATPVWTDVQGNAATCGTCHGIPPSNAWHDPGLTFHDCTTCHPDIDGNGNFVIPSEHINGTADVR